MSNMYEINLNLLHLTEIQYYVASSIFRMTVKHKKTIELF